jgi:transcriptional regulator with XRE-family HTH domain
MGLTQEQVAQYLQTSREQIAYYEAGTRSVQLQHLDKLASLFCVNEFDLYEKDSSIQKINLAFAFRSDYISVQDLENIAQFKKVVRNYLNMKKVMYNG